MSQGNVEGTQFLRIYHDLVLLDHAAKRRDFRDARHGLKLILQEPVLQAPQLTEIMLASLVDEGVEIDPPHASGIWAKLWARTIR